MDNEQIDIDDDDVLVEGGPLDALVVGDAVVTQAEPPLLVSEQDLDALFGEDEDDEDLDLEDDEEVVADPDAFELPEAGGDRVAKLETAVKDLAGDAVKREQRRVRRKVTAATGGAGAIGCLPILLQLAGALDMDPEVASAVAAAAAALGALIAGWATPERELPPELLSLD